MKKKLMVLFIIMALVVVSAQSVFAVCSGIPDGFYGTLKINGGDAPAGTQIRAILLGEVKGTYTTTVAGQYGSDTGDDKLYVYGWTNGTGYLNTISFEVYAYGSWVDSGETSTYQCGFVKNLDIDVEAQLECTVDADCDDSQYCNGAETCVSNSCQAGTAINCNDGVGCTDDACNEQIDSCSNTANDANCDDQVSCTDDTCDALLDCQNNANNANCDDGQYCNGVETCDAINDCQAGTAIDCSANDLPSVGQCDYSPDDNPFTWDYYAGFTSTCDEDQDACTTGNVDLTHTCDIAQCSAECVEGLNCESTDCSGNNGCYDGTYREYYDVPSVCTDYCACTDGVCDDYGEIITDIDQDGYDVECDNDCNDDNALINPDATEICDNQVDDDCNGLTDGDDPVCGGEPTDTDGDGVPDSEDNCPNDANSNQEDTDSDNIGDVCDACPNDPDNDADQDGVCGDVDVCPGFDDTVDTDSDGMPDGCDSCPNDANKLEPGICGCGVADTDSDSDGVADCNDICQGYDDNVDSDQDGIPDGCDTCPNDADNDADQDGVCGDVDVCPGFDDTVDADGDGIPDGCDNCPNDPNKTEPGQCGCGVADTDSDGDGFADCNDVCQGYDDNIDSDQDGTPDGCDEDVTKYQATITIYNGWTLFALPYNPALLGIDDSEELGQAIMDDTGLNCDVIMTFDGETQDMVSDLLGQPDTPFGLSGTMGYFIGCDGTGTFTYEGALWE